MEWNYDTFKWLLLMVIIPGSAYLINVGIRCGFDIPLSSGSDLILALVIYSACVVADPQMLNALVTTGIREHIVPIHLTFLMAAGLGWVLSTVFIERKLNFYYKTVKTDIEEARFPFCSWALTWSVALSIVAVYLFVIQI